MWIGHRKEIRGISSEWTVHAAENKSRASPTDTSQIQIKKMKQIPWQILQLFWQ